MKVSTKNLDEAEQQYGAMTDKYAAIEQMIKNFNQQVLPLYDSESQRYKDEIKHLREEVYIPLAAACLAAPEACIPMTIAAVAAVETDVHNMKKNLKEFKSKMDGVLESTHDALKMIEAKNAALKQELSIITEWDNDAMLDSLNYNASDPQAITIFKSAAISDFQKMHDITQAFIDHVLNHHEKNLMVIRKNTISHFLTKIPPITDMSTCNL